MAPLPVEAAIPLRGGFVVSRSFVTDLCLFCALHLMARLFCVLAFLANLSLFGVLVCVIRLWVWLFFGFCSRWWFR